MPIQNGKQTLRVWNDTHIDKVFSVVREEHEDELFFNCEFKDVRNARLIHCDLSRSKFTSDNLEDLIGLTISLECHTFNNIELSETALLALIALLLKTKGNTDIRRRILDAVGPEKLGDILRKFQTLER